MTSAANHNAEAADEATELDLLRALARAAVAFRADPGMVTTRALYDAAEAYSDSLAPLRARAERDRELAELVCATIQERTFDPDAFWMAARKLALERCLDPDPLHPTGRCTCGGEGHCSWCQAHPEPADAPDPCGCEHVEALQSKLDRTLVHLEQRNDELNQALRRIRNALPHLKHRGCCTANVYVAKAIAVLEGKP